MLIRKMWRDLMKNKTQFISIFLMSFLGMFVFVGIDAESTGAGECARSYYQKYNLCDLWVMGAGFILLVLPATVLKGLFSAAAVDSLWEND